MVETIDSALRDNNTLGDPGSGDYKVKKGPLRTVLKRIEASAGIGAVAVATKAELDAITDKADNAPGFVVGDSTASNNGQYSWDDSGSAWVKIRDLPDTLAVLENIGGTANAITADTATGVDPAAVQAIVLTAPPGTNTGAVTITLNGGSAEDVKAASGTDPAPGDIVEDVATIFFKVGSEWRQIFTSNPNATFDHQGDYDNGTTYTLDQVVTGSDDNWYQLKAASATGDDPVSGGSGDWLKILDGVAIPDNSITSAKKTTATIAKDEGFKTIPLLIADTDLTYTASQPGTVAVGDILKAEGFRFQVLSALDASTDVSTAGGVDLLCLPNDEGAYSIRQFYMSGDGTDYGLALGRAATKQVGKLVFDTGTTIRLETVTTFDAPIELTATPDTTIVPTVGLAGGFVLNFETDDVYVHGLTLDATGETFTPATGNTHIIHGGDGTTKYYRHRYIANKIISAKYNANTSVDTNLQVTHGFYIDNVDDVSVSYNTVDDIYGACVFARDINGLEIVGNTFKDGQWYMCQIVEGCHNYRVVGNKFLSGLAVGMFWGGAVNTVADGGNEKGTNGYIGYNHFEGKYSYGAVIRIQSHDHVMIEHNVLEDLALGSHNPSQDLTGIRVITRGVSTSDHNDACNNITIRNNRLVGPSSGANRAAIYCSNDWNTTRLPGENYRIYDNEIISPDGTNYWENGIIINGMDGGFKNVWVERNVIEAYLQSSAFANGALAFIGNDTDGRVENIYFGANDIKDPTGTPASSYQIGIAINTYADKVYQTAKNRVENFYVGLRTFTNSGPTIEGVNDNEFVSCTSDTLYQVAPSKYGKPLVGTKSYDPASLAANTGVATTVTVTGAQVGDRAIAYTDQNMLGATMSAYVVSTNSVQVVYSNNTGGTIDIASGTITVEVERPTT